MFIALDENNNRTEIDNADSNKKYFCPICNEELSIKATKSVAVKAHFAHKRNSQCIDDWNHDMSEWHLNWQKRFPSECREVVIENNGIKHRADVCIGKNVIEFQHSPLSSEEFKKRNEFYTSCGYEVVWVFDAERKIKNPYDDYSLDPTKSCFSEFVWKRPKETFSKGIQNKVSIFLEYTTTITPLDKKYENTPFTILLCITKMTPKWFNFLKTYVYILPHNFLKDFGIYEEGKEDVLSVSEIIEKTPKIY